MKLATAGIVTIPEQRILPVEQCWGCNRLRIPKPHRPQDFDKLRKAGIQIRFREYLCAHDDCGANAIAEPRSKGGNDG